MLENVFGFNILESLSFIWALWALLLFLLEKYQYREIRGQLDPISPPAPLLFCLDEVIL